MAVRCKSKNKNTEIIHEIGYACDYVKILTARKMFEELGYKQFIGDKEHYEIGEFIQYNNYEHGRWIRFDFYDKTINCSMYDDPVEPMDITINELKAINKQVLELGWNNE